MNNRLSRRQREHICKVKEMPCSLCDMPGPSAAHHIEQSLHYCVVALCWECHQGTRGWHGDKTLWRLRKATELTALNVTIERLTT